MNGRMTRQLYVRFKRLEAVEEDEGRPVGGVRESRFAERTLGVDQSFAF